MFMYSILLSLKTSIAISPSLPKPPGRFVFRETDFLQQIARSSTHHDQADGALVRAVLANGCERCHFRHISDVLIDCHFCSVIADVVP